MPYSRLRHLHCLPLLGILLLFSGCWSSRSESKPFDLSSAQYVGRASCSRCHQKEVELFQGSHHDRAMDLATDETVLADFNDAAFEHHGITSRFFRDGSKFMVNTEGPDGRLSDFQIKYVFGVDPLQQYMVEFPTADNALQPGELPRVQVLRLCWATQEKEWFYLPPPDVPEKLEPEDDLHWTGIAQRWNTMCAECHSTDYQKNFSLPNSHTALRSAHAAAENQGPTGRYNSTFVEIDVSCEACHGPASVHIELANKWFPGWNRQRGYGLANLKLSAENQIQACAPCHSRRNVLASGFKAGDNYYDFYTNQLLTEGIYYPDGQVLDEDYVHGSFIQSKMYHKGIQCSDCHDPHSARLKHDGNQVCTSCHQHPAAKYDSVSHHFHKPEGVGSKCVNCHMPSTTYMAVDARRDHSLRIPRPDLSLQIGTPNACTGCHLEPENVSPEKRDQLRLYQDWMQAARDGDAEVQAELERANQWCDQACDRWYAANRRRDKHFGVAIAAAQQGNPDAADLLLGVLERRGFEAPALARASALQELFAIDSLQAARRAEDLIHDAHPLVRSSAASALVGTDNASKSVRLLEAALKDPVRSVRIEAARNLLNFPANLWSKGASAAFRKALDELTDGLQFSNDRAGAHLALGILAEQQGRDQQAIKHYEAAISVEPAVTGPRTNLAALLDRNISAQSHASGAEPPKLMEEIKRLRQEELRLLERDMNLLPDNAAIQYRYGLALYLNRDVDGDVEGALEKAAEHLVKAAELEPGEAQYAQTVAMLYEQMQQWDAAVRWAKEAVERSGNDPAYLRLLEQIRSSAAAP